MAISRLLLNEPISRLANQKRATFADPRPVNFKVKWTFWGSGHSPAILTHELQFD